MPALRRRKTTASPHSITPHAPAIASRLEEWFLHAQRQLPWRRNYDPYQIWVSEVMLQQTRMEVVVPYFERFIARFPDVQTLAEAEQSEVLAHWSGLGYYRRAMMLHEGAREVMREHSGVIPSHLDALRTIRGIGRYTAGAIVSIAFDRPAPIVDGNVQRVTARLAALPDPVGSTALNDATWRIAEELVAASVSPRTLNQALMEHGAMTCRPQSPRCESCCIAELCRGRLEAADYPRPAEAKARVALRVPLFVVRDVVGRVLLQRHSGRLMNAMFHLPHGSDALLDDASPRFVPGPSRGEFRHTITHRDITFELVEADMRAVVAENPGESIWIDPSQPLDVPHPSYVKKALKIVATKWGGER
jgi:A/G-specific adenine glycosylase